MKKFQQTNLQSGAALRALRALRSKTPCRTANEAAELRLSATICTANFADGADGSWAVIAPYGDHPSPDGSYVQHLDRAQAETIVKTWNSITGKAVRWFKNLAHGLGAKFSAPVWEGHPDSDSGRWPKEKLLAEITDLRTGNDGLEGRRTWNAKGMAARASGPLFPSSLWWHLPPSGVPPTVYPEVLESVGLVRTPNISGVPAWTQNAQAFTTGNEDAGHEFHGNQWTEEGKDLATQAHVETHGANETSRRAETDPSFHGRAGFRHEQAATTHRAAAAAFAKGGDQESAATHRKAAAFHDTKANQHRDPKTHNAAGEDASAPTLAGNPQAENQTANTQPMNQEQLNALRKSLGLPETADPAACIQAATTANAALAKLAERESTLTTANSTISTLNGERDTLRTQHGALATERDGLKTANANLTTANGVLTKGLLDVAEKRGVITPAERMAFADRIATANTAQAALDELATRKPAMNVTSVDINGKKLDITTANARMEALETEVKRRMEADKCDRDTAFAKCLADPQLAALTGAMADPTRKAS